MSAIRKKIIAIPTGQGMIFSWWNSQNPKDLMNRTPNRPMMHHAETVRQISYIAPCLPRVSSITWLYHRTRCSAITEVGFWNRECYNGLKMVPHIWVSRNITFRRSCIKQGSGLWKKWQRFVLWNAVTLFSELQPLLQKAAQQLRTGIMLLFRAEKSGTNRRQTV